MTQIRVSSEGLKSFFSASLERCGVAEHPASVAADVIVRTTLRGVDTHGIRMFPSNLKRLRDGGINPRAQPTVVSETVATAVLDGDCGLGQYVAATATDLVLTKAAQAGCATVLVRNSSHLGASGVYALRCAESGMYSMVHTNGIVSMRVTGSVGPGISSGTRAYGIPGRDWPIVLDISMAPSGQKIAIALERGLSVPPGWLVDAKNAPTTDPVHFTDGGTRIPIGEHKGYGMALVAELLVSALSGSPSAWEAGRLPGPDDRPWRLGHAIIAVDVAAFMSMSEFLERVDNVLEQLRQLPEAEGSEGIRIPGEQAARTEQLRLAEGIPVEPIVWDRLVAAAEPLRCLDLLMAARVLS